MKSMCWAQLTYVQCAVCRKAPHPNPTHNKVSTFQNPDVLLRQQKKEQMKRMWEMKNEAKRKEMEIIGDIKQ